MSQFQNITGDPTYGVSITVREVVNLSNECVSELKELRRKQKVIDRIVANYRTRKAKEQEEKLEKNSILNSNVVKTIRRNSMMAMRYPRRNPEVMQKCSFNTPNDNDVTHKRHSEALKTLSESFRVDRTLQGKDWIMALDEKRPHSDLDISISEKQNQLPEMIKNQMFEFTPIDDLMNGGNAKKVPQKNAKDEKNGRHIEVKNKINKNERMKAPIMQFLLPKSKVQKQALESHRTMVENFKISDVCIVEQCYILLGTKPEDSSLLLSALESLIQFEEGVS